MAALPPIAAAMNFVVVIASAPTIPAKIAALDSLDAIGTALPSRLASSRNLRKWDADSAGTTAVVASVRQTHVAHRRFLDSHLPGLTDCRPIE